MALTREKLERIYNNENYNNLWKFTSNRRLLQKFIKKNLDFFQNRRFIVKDILLKYAFKYCTMPPIELIKDFWHLINFNSVIVGYYLLRHGYLRYVKYVNDKRGYRCWIDKKYTLIVNIGYYKYLNNIIFQRIMNNDYHVMEIHTQIVNWQLADFIFFIF